MLAPFVTRPHHHRVLTDYCGAGSRLPPDRGLALDTRRWAWMPKVDGVYARVSLDRRGRIANVLARSGSPLREASDLIGILAGPPDSVLHGELEAHTEAGNRLSSLRGWRALHLFDATRIGGTDVSARAFADRYGMLHAAQAEIELAGRRNPWVNDDQGDAHDSRTGRYCQRIPRDIRRLPIIPLARGIGAADRLWREHVAPGGEGLVAVRLDAPARARGAKRKIKATDTLDCRVLSCDAGAARLEYGGRIFVTSARGRWSSLAPGDVVEIACDGWYERDATPRFARIVRVRADLLC